MFNNRKLINGLKSENEALKRRNKEYLDEMILSRSSKDSFKNANIKLVQKNTKLEKNIEIKENFIYNLLDANKELSQENEHLRNKINTLEKLVKCHEENECKLNTELCKATGKLDKIKNMYRTLTGEEIE